MNASALSVHDVGDPRQWEQFLHSLAPHTFLQSWQWRRLHEQIGEPVMAIGAFQGDTLVGIALAILVRARRGTFLFCPHGPLALRMDTAEGADIIRVLLEELRTRALQKHASFLRVSPLALDTPDTRSFYARLGYRPAPIHVHAERMWILDLTPSEETLLAQMRKTTRNLIRRAEREGVTVRFSTDQTDVDTFEQLYAETAERERFVPFSHAFLAAEFDAFVPEGKGFLAFAEYQGKPIAGALIINETGRGFYHQGASSRAHKKTPAAYLLHWRIAQHLKQSGCLAYNFWGIAPENAPQHPWAGLTLFKQGFGGAAIDYLHAQDLPLRPNYWFTYLIETLRRKKRGV